MDSLYGDEDKFAAWVAARRRLAFLLSAYTEFDQGRERHAAAACSTSGVSRTPRRCRTALTPGTDRLRAVRSGWTCMAILLHAPGRPDPLKQALTMIPGYPMVRPPPVHAKKRA